MSGEHANGGRWSLDDIPLHCVDATRVRSNAELFLLLAGASFVETASDLYTRNLVEQFRDDPEVSSWLTGQWEPQELQHGRTHHDAGTQALSGVDGRQDAAEAAGAAAHAQLAEPRNGQAGATPDPASIRPAA